MDIIDNLVKIEARKLQDNIYKTTGEWHSLKYLEKEVVCKLQYAN